MDAEQRLIELDLSHVSTDVVSVLIDDVSDPAIFGEIAKANTGRPEILELLLDCPDTPSDVRDLISGSVKLPVVRKTQALSAGGKEKEKESDAKHESLIQKIQRLNVAERIQLGLKGGREIRGILARDSNKQVVLGVLSNGKITESEIELICKNRSTVEDVLRKISKNREWMKKYAILYALITNPKTPAGIAVTFVSGLKTRDLALMGKNKNISEAVRIASKKLYVARKQS